jgi:plasmid maintenance system antidote protein VapI
VPASRISEIVAARRAISADTDLRRCRVLGLNPGYWRQFHAAAMQHCVSTQLLQIPD